jgi:hypothetical protein
VLKITFDTADLTRQLTDIQRRQIPFATARALTAVGKEAARIQQQVTNESIDRPNQFTAKQSIYSTSADKRGPYEVTVGYKQKQAAYLAPLLGGDRRQRPVEVRAGGSVKYVIPGDKVAAGIAGIKLDRYGNVKQEDLIGLLNQTNTYGTAGRFFRGVPKGNQGLGDGVYARVDNNNKIVPVLLFITDAKYIKRLDFTKAQRELAKLWPKEFEAALSQALATARQSIFF